MQTKENLSQTVKDVKVEIIKDVFKKQNTAEKKSGVRSPHLTLNWSL